MKSTLVIVGMIALSMNAMAKDSKKSVANRKVASAACGDVNTALSTMREVSRKGTISTPEAAQVMSALISYKLDDKKLSAKERESLQAEHEAACSF